jgi:hypothetical protein
MWFRFQSLIGSLIKLTGAVEERTPVRTQSIVSIPNRESEKLYKRHKAYCSSSRIILQNDGQKKSMVNDCVPRELGYILKWETCNYMRNERE